jgi:transposase
MKDEKENLFFEKKEIFVGIDVHKATWVVTIRTYDLELKTYSMQPQAEVLEKFLKTVIPMQFIKLYMSAALADSGYTITFLRKVTR